MACHKREIRASSKEACEIACQNKESCTSMWHPDEKPSSRDRYYYIFDKMGWGEAKEFCESNNSRLAVVENWEDHDELRKITDGTATRMVERIGDAIQDRAASKTMEVVGKLTSGASVFFSKTAWIGLTTVPTNEPNYDFEYVWDGAPELDNLKTGGSPLPNAYNWGWSVEFFDKESRQFTNDPKCGVVERNMWNRRDCDDDLPFICERLGKCEICDTSGEENTYISSTGDYREKSASVNGVANSRDSTRSATGPVEPPQPATGPPEPPRSATEPPDPPRSAAEPLYPPRIATEPIGPPPSATELLPAIADLTGTELDPRGPTDALFNNQPFRLTDNLPNAQAINETLKVEKVKAVNEIIDLLKML